ncbi:MAG: MOSC domain-containing protein [Planctomycetia bacterium]|nr:MOSC domain-containing protein [Planctomycetia bacterium]
MSAKQLKLRAKPAWRSARGKGTVSTTEQSHAIQTETLCVDRDRPARVIAVSASPGGVPKWPLKAACVTTAGLVGDGHAHQKHNRPDRALSLLDLEIIDQLRDEGFDLQPGTLGENLSVANLSVQQMPPGTLLSIGDVVLKLEQPRKPCYVLDHIDPRLKDVLVGRCGYMASVVQGGMIRPGMEIVNITAIEQSHPAFCNS